MAVTLDPATEERIQRQIDQGNFREPAEVLGRDLDLLDEDQSWPSGELESSTSIFPPA